VGLGGFLEGISVMLVTRLVPFLMTDQTCPHCSHRKMSLTLLLLASSRLPAGAAQKGHSFLSIAIE
jgi:hypothetical protein